MIAALQDMGELKEAKRDIFKVTNMGSKIAAGMFNQDVVELSDVVTSISPGKDIRSTLQVCKPSLTHLFGDEGGPIETALDAIKHSLPRAPTFHQHPSFSASSRHSFKVGD
jgi:hypothetical protein